MKVTKWNAISGGLLAALAVASCQKRKRTGPGTPPSPRASPEPTSTAHAAPTDAALPDAAPTELDGVRVGVLESGPEPWAIEPLVGRGIPALSVDGRLYVRAGNGNAGPNMEPGLNVDLVDVATGKVVKQLMVLDRNLEETPALAALEQAARAANDELAKIQWLTMLPISALCDPVQGCQEGDPYGFSIDTPALHGRLTWHDPNLTWQPSTPGGKPFASKPKWNPKPYRGEPDLPLCTHSAGADLLWVAPGSKTVLVATRFMLTHACEGVEGTIHAVTLP
ncbi:MAG: hypothetical protein IT370_04170 [Deltaproteobacteria bacterium]|nr:hypothetical protein [Deltaproteobacteria bacterium]